MCPCRTKQTAAIVHEPGDVLDKVHHSGIPLYTPADVHHARIEERRLARKTVLSAAYKAHLERFVDGAPAAQTINPIVYINQPVLSNAA